MAKTPVLHLVGGFLGSGKTTAIVQACKLLADSGLRAGVVTNDQGKYLVDTAFVRLQDLPAVEVGGGCFCCNYADLETQLKNLVEGAGPDVIFAESVGSCADLVATVIKPLLSLRHSPMPPASFSVFADARLLSMHLRGLELPFSEDVTYIFEQQLLEAGLVVVNKLDLIPQAKQADLLAAARERLPGRNVLGLSALEPAQVSSWLEVLRSGSDLVPRENLAIDYRRYGAGEKQLAWLDQQVTLNLPEEGQLHNLAAAVLSALDGGLRALGVGVGHLKFVVSDSFGHSAKISFTSLPTPGWEGGLPDLKGRSLHLAVNARAELPAVQLASMAEEALREQAELFGAQIQVSDRYAFHPGLPRPTHRMD